MDEDGVVYEELYENELEENFEDDYEESINLASWLLFYIFRFQKFPVGPIHTCDFLTNLIKLLYFLLSNLIQLEDQHEKRFFMSILQGKAQCQR